MILANNKKFYAFALSGVLAFGFSGAILDYVHIQNRSFNMDSTLTKSYSSVDQLIKDSSLIVEVAPISSNSFKFENVVFTNTNVKIEKILKGSQSPDNTISILETGGNLNGISYKFEDVTPLEKGRKYYLFLNKYKGPINNTQYVITGAFQGRFEIKNNTLIPANPKLNHFKVQTVTELESKF